MNHDQRILELKAEHPDWGDRRVAQALGLARTTVQQARVRLLGGSCAPPPAKVTVSGVTPDSFRPDPASVWQQVVERQEKATAKLAAMESQAIEIHDSKPVGIAMFSDLHLGNPNADYRQILRDTDTVVGTDGFYATSWGDAHDNWIGKLEGIQRGQPISFDAELTLVQDWFRRLQGKLLAVCSGNHEHRTVAIAGQDHIRGFLSGAQLLYDASEVSFRLKLGSAEWRVKGRHRWRYNSILNPTHGIERDLERGDVDFDIGVGGHVHKGTLFREFPFRGRVVTGCLIGTYKLDDEYGRQCGFAKSIGSGCGALILYPDGKLQSFRELSVAAEFLKWLRR
jgi:hypothetical protein